MELLSNKTQATYSCWDLRRASTHMMRSRLIHHDRPDCSGVCCSNEVSAETDDLILYFERTYVGRMLPSGSYQQPLFSIQIWNYHFDVAYGLPRTTNAVEAWLAALTPL